MVHLRFISNSRINNQDDAGSQGSAGVYMRKNDEYMVASTYDKNPLSTVLRRGRENAWLTFHTRAHG